MTDYDEKIRVLNCHTWIMDLKAIFIEGEDEQRLEKKVYGKQVELLPENGDIEKLREFVKQTKMKLYGLDDMHAANVCGGSSRAKDNQLHFVIRTDMKATREYFNVAQTAGRRYTAAGLSLASVATGLGVVGVGGVVLPVAVLLTGISSLTLSWMQYKNNNKKRKETDRRLRTEDGDEGKELAEIRKVKTELEDYLLDSLHLKRGGPWTKTTQTVQDNDIKVDVVTERREGEADITVLPVKGMENLLEFHIKVDAKHLRDSHDTAGTFGRMYPQLQPLKY